MRPFSWSKNILLLLAVPYLLAEGDVAGLMRLGLLFVAFCLSASSIYLVNDLVDRERDRMHPRKALRPIAAGTVSVPSAVVAAVLLACLSIALGWFLGLWALLVVVTYLCVADFYTFIGKHIPWIEFLFLEAFHSIRVLGGFIVSAFFPPGWLGLIILAGLGGGILGVGRRESELHILGARAGTRNTLTNYSRKQLNVLFWGFAVAIIAIYLATVWTISMLLVAATSLLVVGVVRFWHIVHAPRDEMSVHKRIARDRMLPGALVLYAIIFIVSVFLHH